MTRKKNSRNAAFIGCLFGTLWIYPVCIFAEEPQPNDQKSLPLDDLLSSKGRWSIGFNAVSVTTDRSSVEIGESVLVQTGPGQFVSVPSEVSEQRVNSDTLVLQPTTRYGLTDKTQLSARLSVSSTWTRTSGLEGERSDSSSRFADAWFGIDHRFIKEGRTPGLFGFVETALVENNAVSGEDLSYAKSWALGLSTYRVSDPIVLRATASYQLRGERARNGTRLDPGDIFSIQPSVSFIPNRDSSLTLGFTWTLRQADKVNSQTLGLLTTRTDLNFGLGYGWSKQLSLFVNLSANVSGSAAASVGISIYYGLEKRH